ncbi:hypothetical protein A6B35_31870 (plasmid) [Mesorhizobium amorphae CCNWGS0123]|nr:hypothetical protein A6B35_31870 [Mesorhizobium amorphae CCNWGS0123]
MARAAGAHIIAVKECAERDPQWIRKISFEGLRNQYAGFGRDFKGLPSEVYLNEMPGSPPAVGKGGVILT